MSTPAEILAEIDSIRANWTQVINPELAMQQLQERLLRALVECCTGGPPVSMAASDATAHDATALAILGDEIKAGVQQLAEAVDVRLSKLETQMRDAQQLLQAAAAWLPEGKIP